MDALAPPWAHASGPQVGLCIWTWRLHLHREVLQPTVVCYLAQTSAVGSSSMSQSSLKSTAFQCDWAVCVRLLKRQHCARRLPGPAVTKFHRTMSLQLRDTHLANAVCWQRLQLCSSRAPNLLWTPETQTRGLRPCALCQDPASQGLSAAAPGQTRCKSASAGKVCKLVLA